MKFAVVAITAAVAITSSAGCATPHVVQATQSSDSALTCSQLDMQIAEADRFRSDAQKEKGVTGTNVAAVLLFWPAMIGTYSNANEAIAAADARKIHLSAIHRQKMCGEAQQQASGAQAIRPFNNSQTAGQKLDELKSLLDKGQITQNEYDEKRKKVVEQM